MSLKCWKCILSQSQDTNFQNFLGEHAPRPPFLDYNLQVLDSTRLAARTSQVLIKILCYSQLSRIIQDITAISSFRKICNDQQSYHCITCKCFLPQSQGGSFLILQDVMGWATGFFIPFLGEGQQKTIST